MGALARHPDPDHALIALCARWLAAKSQYERLYDSDTAGPGSGWLSLAPSAPSNVFYRPATTVAGFAAKARVVKEDCATEFEQSPGLAALINELIGAH
jgi:hypothetical protein